MKDLRIEFRSKSMLTLMLLFSLLIVLSFRFAFSGSIESGSLAIEDLASSALWICFSFAAIVGMHASFEKEKDRETLDGLLLCPVDRGEIFLGKTLSNIIVVFFADLLSILFFGLFFSYDYGGYVVDVIVIALLGTLALVLVGTLVAAMSVNAKAREALFPVLLIPLIAFSVIIPSVSATKSAVLGELSNASQELQLISGFAIIFGVIGYLTFEYILEE